MTREKPSVLPTAITTTTTTTKICYSSSFLRKSHVWMTTTTTLFAFFTLFIYNVTLVAAASSPLWRAKNVIITTTTCPFFQQHQKQQAFVTLYTTIRRKTTTSFKQQQPQYNMKLLPHDENTRQNHPLILFASYTQNMHSRLSSSSSSSMMLFSVKRNDDVHQEYDDDEEEEEYDKNDNNNDVVKIRYRGRIAYDGTGYSGWQTQSKGRTVQAELELILSKRFNRSIKIVGAGRTDAGVHARGQAFHFDLVQDDLYSGNYQQQQQSNVEKKEDNDEDEEKEETFTRKLQSSLNSMLRGDTRVWNLSRAPIEIISNDDDDDDDNDNSTTTTTKNTKDTLLPSSTYQQPSHHHRQWHAIMSAQSKLYSYRITTNDYLDPIQRHTRVHIYDTVNITTLQSVLQYYVGTHDFRAFAGAIESNMRKSGLEYKNTVRTVYKVVLVEEEEGADGGNYRIDFYLKGALYKMVRNMVGMALEVARGKLEEDVLVRLLYHDDGDDEEEDEVEKDDGRNKRQFVRDDNPCKPAPPEGLTLERVFYNEEDDDF